MIGGLVIYVFLVYHRHQMTCDCNNNKYLSQQCPLFCYMWILTFNIYSHGHEKTSENVIRSFIIISHPNIYIIIDVENNENKQKRASSWTWLVKGKSGFAMFLFLHHTFVCKTYLIFLIGNWNEIISYIQNVFITHVK